MSRLGASVVRPRDDQVCWRAKIGKATRIVASQFDRSVVDRDTIREKVLGHARVALGDLPDSAIHRPDEAPAGDGEGTEPQECLNSAAIFRLALGSDPANRRDARATETVMLEIERELDTILSD
jgi:hypothetical protein